MGWRLILQLDDEITERIRKGDGEENLWIQDGWIEESRNKTMAPNYHFLATNPTFFKSNTKLADAESLTLNSKN